MLQSKFKSYDELPLFLNARTVAQVLGISQAGAYELLHQEGFPVLKIGSRLVVPKEKFLSWIESRTGGNTL
ncbi:helix-turn-helix domain-containing protein [Acutalibacter sp. JLR.KK004]|jgi:predicted DNA-binding transcriptional regulator AlpA|uniref:helix-turn-helix domain-containing protein n=1 Tax=Acutalibacter sp. JLR.KK004 TaxID=3112622 RepID=UPI002FF28C04